MSLFILNFWAKQSSKLCPFLGPNTFISILNLLASSKFSYHILPLIYNFSNYYIKEALKTVIKSNAAKRKLKNHRRFLNAEIELRIFQLQATKYSYDNFHQRQEQEISSCLGHYGKKGSLINPLAFKLSAKVK